MFSLGASTQPKPGLFGASSAPAQQQTGSLFGASMGAQSQPQPTSSLFANSTQQQPQQQAAGFSGSLLGASQQNTSNLGSSIWQLPTPQSREKSISEQMQVIMEKWHPESPNCVFQHYFYNQVPLDRVAYYNVPQGEDGKKWEEALSKKPSEGSIPVLARGFLMVAERLKMQVHAVSGLQSRLHEIDAHLSQVMQNHDLKITVRATEAKRRHVALSHRCLALATKVQVFRNRGYAMGPIEEELRKKLAQLDKTAFDPVLTGRQEEIWARMSGLRARAQLLQQESEKIGHSLTDADDEVFDDDTIQKVKKILGDYDSQLSHLKTELDHIRKDFEQWRSSTIPEKNGSALRR